MVEDEVDFVHLDIRKRAPCIPSISRANINDQTSHEKSSILSGEVATYIDGTIAEVGLEMCCRNSIHF